MRFTSGGPKERPRRSESRRPRGTGAIGPTESRSTPDGKPARSNGSMRPGATRFAAMIETGPLSNRLSAKERARADGMSVHCTSSMAIRTGPSAVSERSTPSTARETARASGRERVGGPRRSAASSAPRWRAGSSSSVPSRAGARRSPRTLKESFLSISDALDSSARNVRRESRSPSCQSLVFPIPASPSSTNARGPDRSSSMNRAMAASSCSRPRISSWATVGGLFDRLRKWAAASS
jgi:hypothetical protein